MERCTRIGIGDNGTVGEMVQAPFTAQHGKRTVYRQGCTAPAWVAGSLVGAPGRASNHFCQPVDIWPTVLDITRTHVEYSGAADRTIDGLSLYPLIRNPDAPAARSSIWQHTFGPNILGTTYPPPGMDFERIAWRETQWSYIERWESGVRTYELYNLIDDPWEGTNLNVPGDITANEAAELARLQAQVAAFLATP
jgi:arylsulfatase A-like enzyme